MQALRANVRQHDPDERAALAELRDGSVDAAIDWYASAGRIHTHADRIETLATMTTAWADDLAAGHDSVLLAWRRVDVADLNRLARTHWDRLGRLDGDDIEITPGRWYAVGDRLVALAPNPAAGIVTSEPLTITAIDDDHLDARTGDGRHVRITGDGLDTDHLDYGYARTIHRAQGATHDRTHVLAAGGGRELAYVALSRARDHTTIHATADSLEQAVDDLHADWSQTRHQRWITDSPAEIGHHPEPVGALTEPQPLVTAPAEPDAPDPALRLSALIDDYHDLHAGTGRWQDTSIGIAAQARSRSRTTHRRATLREQSEQQAARTPRCRQVHRQPHRGVA